MENLMNRKVPRGVAFPLRVMVEGEEAAEKAGITFSEFVAETLAMRLQESEGDTESEVKDEAS